MKEMRRKDRMMTNDEAWAALQDADVLRLGMISAEEPYIIPVNFIAIDNSIYFHSATTGRKLEPLTSGNRVCLEVDELIGIKQAPRACGFSCYYKSVIAYGIPFEVVNNQEKADILTALTKRYSDSAFTAVSEDEAARVSVFGVKIEMISGKQNMPLVP